MATNQKKLALNTPIGTARYPWLNQPDTRFNDEGLYTVQLLLPEDDPKVKAIIKKLKEVYDEFRSDLKDPKRAKKEPESYGFTPDVDENGDETGYLIFKFKAKTGYLDKKTGERKELAPPALFDAKLKEMSRDIPIWSGTTMIINFTPSAYMSGAKCGVTLYINACQIIELSTSGNKDAASYGFQAEEVDCYETEMEESETLDAEVDDGDF